ncbi:outer membrane efflux protein [Candidatus Magnetomorum sp. HK-1]|nr:outer membrane efflux protein [Candidatus Magnetomorum sp. HK-1]
MIQSNKFHCVLLFGYLFLYALTCTAFASDSQKILWQSIRILDLETAQWIALAENKDFAASTARIGQAMAQKKQAGASYWPKINFSAGAVRTKLSDTLYNAQIAPIRLINPLAELDDPIESYTLSLSISYALFDGFLSKNQFLSAQLGHEISQRQHQNYKRVLLQQVANLFFRTQLARENVSIAEANIDFYQQKLDEAKARQDIGSGSLSDALNFQVQLNAARTTQIQANETYQLALLDMADSLGIPCFSDHVTLARLETEKAKDLAEPDISKNLEKALEHRPEIILYQKMIEQAEKQKKATMAYQYPFIQINANYQGERKNNYHWGDANFGNTFSANITYPIFAGGYYNAKTKQAKYKVKETQNIWQHIQKSINSGVRKAIERVKAAQDQVRLQRDNAILVQRNRDLVEKEYAAGQNSLVRLNEAQRDLITAKSRSAAALVSLHQAWKNLMAETGQILLSFE